MGKLADQSVCILQHSVGRGTFFYQETHPQPFAGFQKGGEQDNDTATIMVVLLRAFPRNRG